MNINRLEETIDLMRSDNYKERFKAEYYQLKIRRDKLVIMLNKWDNGTLAFTPTVSREIYDEQLYFMNGYLRVLQSRAVIEEVTL